MNIEDLEYASNAKSWSLKSQTTSPIQIWATIIFICFSLICFKNSNAAHTEKIFVKAGDHTGYIRLAFNGSFTPEFKLSSSRNTIDLILHHRADIDIQHVNRVLKDTISFDIKQDPEKMETRVKIYRARPFKISSFKTAKAFIIDLYPLAKEQEILTFSSQENTSAHKDTDPQTLFKPKSQSPKEKLGKSSTLSVEELKKKEILEKKALSFTKSSVTLSKSPIYIRATTAPIPQLELESLEPIRIAALRRGGYVWVFFNRHPAESVFSFDQESLKKANLRVTALSRAGDHLAVLKIAASGNLYPYLTVDKNTYILTLKSTPSTPQRWLTPQKIKEPQKTSFLTFDIEDQGPLPHECAFTWQDPEIGDEILIIPIAEVGAGAGIPMKFVDLHFLASAQGLILKPLHKNIQVSCTTKQVKIGIPSRLMSGKENSKNSLSSLPSLIDWKDKTDPSKTWAQRFAILQKVVSSASEDTVVHPSLDLIKFFIASGRYSKALSFIIKTHPLSHGLEQDHELNLLKAIVLFLTHRYKEAETILISHPHAKDPELLLWQGVLAGKLGDERRAHHLLSIGKSSLELCPIFLKVPLGIAAVEVALQANNVGLAKEYMEVLNKLPQLLDKADHVFFLKGQISEASGKTQEALKIWQSLASSSDGTIKAQAEVAQIFLHLRLKSLSIHEAIHKLERLRYAWRGDHLELKVAYKLAQLYITIKNYPKGLSLFKNLYKRFSSMPTTRLLYQEAQEAFGNFFTTEASHKVSLLKELGFFEEFKIFLPSPPLREIILNKMIDRLIEGDLLSLATHLLEDHLYPSLKEAERDKAANRLALLYLLDEKPSQALRIIEKAEKISLPTALKIQQNHIKAQALAKIGEKDHALKIIEEDPSPEATQIKIDIYWRNQEWKLAAHFLKDLLKQDIISMPEHSKNSLKIFSRSQFILNLAIALYLDHDQEGLKEIRQEFSQSLENDPLYAAFNLLTHPLDSVSEINQQTIKNQATEIAKFDLFMEVYRKKLKQGGVNTFH